MFMPASSPTESLELVCESVVGRRDPVNNLRYAVRPFTGEDGNEKGLLSDAALFILNSQGTVAGLARSNANILHRADDANEEEPEQFSSPSNDITLATEVRQAIREILINGGFKRIVPCQSLTPPRKIPLKRIERSAVTWMN